jgi:hypothetical protein
MIWFATVKSDKTYVMHEGGQLTNKTITANSNTIAAKKTITIRYNSN